MNYQMYLYMLGLRYDYMFLSDSNVVGGLNTEYDMDHNFDYARIDCSDVRPGYFAYRGSLGDTIDYCIVYEFIIPN